MYNDIYTQNTENQKQASGKSGKKRQAVKFAAFGLCCAVLGGTIGGLGVGAAGNQHRSRKLRCIQEHVLQRYPWQT